MGDSLDYKLLKSLKDVIPTPNLKSKTYSKLVKEIQSLLVLGGFYRGALDGIWGAATEVAFQEFKEKAYLEFPNVLGASTAEALLELAGEATHQTPSEALQAAVVKPAPPEASFKLPNSNSIVYCNGIIPGCRHFTWGEATKNGARIPENPQVIQNIIRLAVYLEEVRSKCGDREVRINSFYRDKKSNIAVGGVSNSRHLLGDAADIVVAGIQPLEVYRLLNTWHGNKGGLGRSPHFTHIDLRGYHSRFTYGR